MNDAPPLPADLAADVDIVTQIDAMPNILDVVCRVTGMGFAAIVRITEDRWVACSVLDKIGFGLHAGSELALQTTLCHDVTRTGSPVIINHVARDPCYADHPSPALHGFESYIAMPICLPDGSLFGTLFAVDREPHRLDTPEIVGTFTLFSALIGYQVDAHRRLHAAGRIAAINRDLTARYAARTAERDVLASLVEATDVLIMAVATDFTILAVNRACADDFTRFYGVRPAAGDHLLHLLAAQPAHRAGVHSLWRRALQGEDFTIVSTIGDGDGERRDHETKFRGLFDESGRRIGAYQFVYDVTDRVADQARLAETTEALRQAQKMEAVGQLTGGIAHDFNNLLTGISGSLEMIDTRIAQGRVQDLGKYSQAARIATKRAASLTHRLLAFSRRQTLDAHPTDVMKLVADMIDLITRTVGPHIMVETVSTDGLWTVSIDPHQLENALLNLCINARDAMPQGGRLTIETENTRLDAAAAAAHDLPAGDYLTLCVADTGEGMTKEVAARVFDPFFTTKPVGLGTGLGLSMVHGFVRQSGGQVHIESAPGQGTRVCIHLPRHHGEAPPVVAPSRAASSHPVGSGTVLVVDDEPTIRMLLAEVVGELGHTVIEAEDGPAAVASLNASQRAGARIDLLITDLGLPGGMNGRQVADAARRIYPALKILFVTGYAENTAIGLDPDPGMTVMTKPFAMDDLAAQVRTLFADI
jgi:signal transduction histidine kinase